MMLIVLLRGMLVNKDLTSKKISLYPSVSKLLGMFLILFKALKLLNSLCVSGLSKQEKCLAIVWLSAPVVSITGLKGDRFSKVL